MAHLLAHRDFLNYFLFFSLNLELLFLIMEEIELVLDMAREQMQKAVQYVKGELGKIRAGKAMPQLLDGLMVEYYGNPTPINQVASINTPDGRTIIVKPWEKNMIPEIEKSILASDLGLNPQNDGELIRIFIPPLTEDRRKNLVKHAKQEAEQGKISLRNARHEAINNLKELKNEGVSEDEVKRGEDKINEFTTEYNNKIDDILVKKEKDIMTV